MIIFNNIVKSYPTNKGKKVVLDGVSFSVPRAKITTIFGPNGCGKSTLMNLLAGLDTPDSGNIEGLSKNRSELGFVFQDYRKTLLPWGTVRENITYPLRLHKVSKSQQHAKLEELLSLTSVKLDLDQRVTGLSGGQAQLVCLLRALIIEPRVLILDEPFSALDYERTILLREILLDLAGRLSLTVLLISHDIDDALYLGDEVVFLSKMPTRTIQTLQVSLARPRNRGIVTSAEFAGLKAKAVEIFDQSIGTISL